MRFNLDEENRKLNEPGKHPMNNRTRLLELDKEVLGGSDEEYPDFFKDNS